MLDIKLVLALSTPIGSLTAFFAIRLALSACICNFLRSSFDSLAIGSPFALSPDGSLQYIDAIVFLATLTNGEPSLGVYITKSFRTNPVPGRNSSP